MRVSLGSSAGLGSEPAGLGRLSQPLAKQLPAPSSHQDGSGWDLDRFNSVEKQQRKTENQEQGLASGDHGKVTQPVVLQVLPEGSQGVLPFPGLLRINPAPVFCFSEQHLAGAG